MTTISSKGRDAPLSRRSLLIGLGIGATSLVAGCSTGSRARIASLAPFGATPYDGSGGTYASAYAGSEMYGPLYDDGFQIPAIDLRRVDPRFYRQEIADPTGAAPGTVVVDTAARYAYFVQPGGRAMRYGVGIGGEGFAWGGNATVQFKKRWPRWTPPAEMVQRKPELAEYADGMEGGLGNPLGARALYLFQNGRDTLYRLHGTPEYWTIGKAVSSGCVRFMNHDIIDLYGRVPDGAPVVVRQGGFA